MEYPKPNKETRTQLVFPNYLNSRPSLIDIEQKLVDFNLVQATANIPDPDEISMCYQPDEQELRQMLTENLASEIADKIKILDECEGNGLLDLNEGEKTYSVYGPMKKAGILKVDVSKGDKHKLENIVFKRTAEVTDLSQVDLVNKVGSKYRNDKSAGSLLHKIDLD